MSDSANYAESSAKRLWTQFTQMFGARFTEQFGPAPTEAWREAVQGLRQDQLRTALTRVRNSGSAFPPSLPEFVAFAQNAPLARVDDRPPDTRDKYLRFADSLMLNYLLRQPGTSLECLSALLAAKDRIAEQYAIIGSAEHVEPQVMRDQLHAAWDRAWVAATPAEIEDGRVKFCRQHGLAA